MVQNDSAHEGFFTGLILGMVKQIGWASFKYLVTKLELSHPSVGTQPVKQPRPTEEEAPAPEPPKKSGWGKR